jgi:hypothetical protein
MIEKIEFMFRYAIIVIVFFSVSHFAKEPCTAEATCYASCRDKIRRVALGYSWGVTFDPKHAYCVWNETSAGSDEFCYPYQDSLVYMRFIIIFDDPLGCDGYLYPWRYNGLNWDLEDEAVWCTPERYCDDGTPLPTFFPYFSCP